MLDLCSSLFIFAAVLGLLALVGHGIWVVAAAILRGMFGQVLEPNQERTGYCVGCGRHVVGPGSSCPSCGLQPSSPLAATLTDSYLVLRQLRDLQDRGVLEADLVDRVQDTLQARKAELLATVAPVPKPEPVILPPSSPPMAVAMAQLPAAEPPVEPAMPVLSAVLIEDQVDEAQPVAAPIVEPPARRRSFTELLTAFMEQRNILWGEVVGGLLIVGCSVALVISLWQTLQQVPYFPFLIMATVTAALFAAGFYTLERWKLHSTSRGLLMIASLLVPLDLLVMAGLHRDLGGRLDGLEIGILAGFLSLFVFLLTRAGRVLWAEQDWLYPAAVLGTSAFELVVPFLGAEPAVSAAMLLGAASAVCHSGTACWVIRHSARKPALEEGNAQQLFGFIGVATFAFATLLGLLVYASQASAAMLQGLAPLFALGGVPLLAGGALVHRRLVNVPAAAGIRTAGTAVALVGTTIQLAAIPLAWPKPDMLVLVCLVNVVVLTDAAFRWQLPIAHAAALASLALGYLTAWHTLAGGAADLTSWLLSNDGGFALVPLVLLLASAGEWLSSHDRPADGITYAWSVAGLALMSLVLATSAGVEQPIQTSLVYFIYATGVLACNQRWQRATLGYIGLTLVPAGTLWLLHGLHPGEPALWGTVLAAETALMGLLACLTDRAHLRWPLRDTAAAVAALAGVLALLQPLPGLSWTTAALAGLAVTVLLLAWLYRQAALTWLASILILLGFLQGLGWTLPGVLSPATLLTALLGQATVTCLIRWLLPRVSRDNALENILLEPLDHATLLSSFLAVPLLALPLREHMLTSVAHASWLAAIWLLIALAQRWVWLFAGFQAALCVAVGFGVTAWLESQLWVADNYLAGLTDPRSLHAYGIGLAGLGLCWGIVRPVLRRHQWIQDLLEPDWPAVDRVVLAVLVLFQLLLAVWAVLPVVFAELGLSHVTARWPDVAMHGYGPGAWMLLSLLTAVVVIRLWDRPGVLPLAGLILLLVTAAVSSAGAATPLSATTLALGLSTCFLIGSLALWLREPLGHLAESIGITLTGKPAQLLRWQLIGCCLAPILILSLIRLAVPTSEGLIDPVVAFVVPLAGITVTLVGHALRERSAGFAFAAGLVGNLALVGGYALHLLKVQPFLDIASWVTLLQLGTAAAAGWGLSWLASRRWSDVWSEHGLGGILMSWQTSMAVLGTVTLLGGGVIGQLAWSPAQMPAAWTVAAGTPLGWIAGLLTTAVLVWRSQERGDRLDFTIVAGLGLGLVALAACTITALVDAEAGYRALLMGAAFFALAWSLQAVPLPFRDDDRESDAAVGVTVGYVLAMVLGLKAAIVHHDHLWAAGAIGMSACVGAMMAVWQRREGWAFAAGLGLNLATALVVWQQHLGTPLGAWWQFLLQANGIASGLVALIWLAARERFLGSGLVATRPYLASQIALAMLGNLPLLGLAFLGLFLLPDPPGLVNSYLADVGQLSGWLALLLPLAAALWYLPWRRLTILVWHGLGCGILAGCFAITWDTGDWLAYHVMTGAWLALMAGVMVLGLIRMPADHFLAFEAGQIGRAAEATGLLVVLLALRSSLDDPGGILWSAGAVLGVAALVVCLGVWSGRARHIYGSGLLINLAGNLLWLEYGPHSPLEFIAANALCLGLASILWLMIELAGRKVEPLNLGGTMLPFAGLARHAAVVLLSMLVANTLSADLAGAALGNSSLITWLALAALAGAQFLAWLRGRHAGGLYGTGLLGAGYLLHDLGLRSDELAWSIGLALAAYVFATTLLQRLGQRWRDQAGLNWFSITQVLAGVIAVMLSFWMSVHFPLLMERLGGPLVLVLLLATALIPTSGQVGAHFFRHVTLLLGTCLLVELGWVLLGTRLPLPWLHRQVALVSALILAASLPLQSWLAEPWHAAARRLAISCVIAAAFVFLATIGMEILSYNRLLDPKRTELEGWAILAGAVSCLYLVGYAIRNALAEGPLPERWRIRLVYLAEVLLFCLFLHLRLTAPWLFRKWLAPYWVFMVMAVAFAGAGLSELCRRRGWKVLAEPLSRTGLLLPLVPLLAFWVNEPAALVRPLAVQLLPGTEPMLIYLELVAREWLKYANIWFLTGLLFGLMALARQSWSLALFAGLAGNFGLWSLWHHVEVSFLVHPQFFLIPLALIALAAEQINREHLSATQAQMLRYVALGILYLASSADMFIAGLDQVGWPLLLMCLCVAGVLVGMLLEVRAYLFLGTGFLFLVIFSMVWHAAVDKQQPWVWWASGIGLGAAILALFAVFEKRRNDVLQLVERIRTWS